MGVKLGVVAVDEEEIVIGMGGNKASEGVVIFEIRVKKTVEGVVVLLAKKITEIILIVGDNLAGQRLVRGGEKFSLVKMRNESDETK